VVDDKVVEKNCTEDPKQQKCEKAFKTCEDDPS